VPQPEPEPEPHGPYLKAIQRAFQFARETRRGCGPVEFLVGIAEGSGSAAIALRAYKHDDHVEQLLAGARPDLARPSHPGGRRAGLAARRLPRRPPRFLIFTVGWGVWFGNRWVSLRDRWFRLRTSRYYRGVPQA
jgi:hypothetical protein